MISADDGFEQYLKENSRLIYSVISTIGCRIPEDREDLVIEGQRVLWNIFKTPQKNSPKGLIRAILYNKLMDYLRDILPLSRSHIKSIKAGKCEKPQIIHEDWLTDQASNQTVDAIDSCIDLTFLLSSKLFQEHHKSVITLTIQGKSDREIMRVLNISKSSLMVYRWEIRRIYEDNYTNS